MSVLSRGSFVVIVVQLVVNLRGEAKASSHSAMMLPSLARVLKAMVFNVVKGAVYQLYGLSGEQFAKQSKKLDMCVTLGG